MAHRPEWAGWAGSQLPKNQFAAWPDRQDRDYRDFRTHAAGLLRPCGNPVVGRSKTADAASATIVTTNAPAAMAIFSVRITRCLRPARSCGGKVLDRRGRSLAAISPSHICPELREH